jgi:hypothetical protein
MIWRSCLLPKSDGSRADKIVRNTDRAVEEIRRPIVTLGLSVVVCADKCRNAVRPYLRPNPGLERGNPELQEIYVCQEFLYFFVHLVNRHADDVFGPDKGTRLCEEIAPVIVDTTIDTWFANWPEKPRSDIERGFYQKLRGAGNDYAGCKTFFSKTSPIDDTALCSRLARNILTLAGYDSGADSLSSERQAFANLVQVSVGWLLDENSFDCLVETAAAAI